MKVLCGRYTFLCNLMNTGIFALYFNLCAIEWLIDLFPTGENTVYARNHIIGGLIRCDRFMSLLHKDEGSAVFLSLTMEAGVLKSDELSVPSISFLQTVMVALLEHLSALQKHHVIGHLHTAHLVGNEQHGATFWILQEGLVHLRAKHLDFICSPLDKAGNIVELMWIKISQRWKRCWW